MRIFHIKVIAYNNYRNFESKWNKVQFCNEVFHHECLAQLSFDRSKISNSILKKSKFSNLFEMRESHVKKHMDIWANLMELLKLFHFKKLLLLLSHQNLIVLYAPNEKHCR